MGVSCQKIMGFSIITTKRNADKHFPVHETYPVCDPTVLATFLVMFWKLAENGERAHIETEMKPLSSPHGGFH